MEMEEEGKSLNDYFNIARRRKYYIVIPMLVFLALSALIALILPPVYRSEATILIERQHIPIELVKSTVVSFADERIQQIKQKIMRIDSINKMISKFSLYANEAAQLSPTELAETFSENVLVEVISADVITQGKQSKATLAFTLSFDHKSPVVAQKVANELVTLFLSENARSRTERAKETSMFLNAETKKYKQRIQNIENKLAEFKDKYSKSLPELRPANMAAIARIENQLQDLKSKKNQLKERRSNLRTQLSMTSSSVSTGKGEKDMPVTLSELKALHSRLLDRYSKSHPDVKRIERKISNFKPGRSKVSNNSSTNPIFVELSKQLKVANIEYDEIPVIRDKLNNRLRDYEINISKTNQVERGYSDLLRDLEGNRLKYKELQAKYMDAKLAQTLEEEQKAEKFSILEPPRVPTKPDKPDRMKIIFFGLLASIMGGLAIGYLVEMMDGNIRGQKALTKIAGFEPLVVIPYITNSDDLAITRKNKINFSIIAGLIFVGMIIAIHFLYMNLDIIWYKFLHKVELLMSS